MAMAMSIFKGSLGVAILRLKTGDWSAPCAIQIENPSGDVNPSQETILLFMSEHSVLSLVARTRLILGQTHSFEPGPYRDMASINSNNDIYAFVRFNNTFTPASLLSNLNGWGVREDLPRHARWHGDNVTWGDVLMNKISIDRSSIGNALYLVVNIAAGGNSTGVIELNGRKNFADLARLIIKVAGDDGRASNNSLNENRSSQTSLNQNRSSSSVAPTSVAPQGQFQQFSNQTQQPNMMPNLYQNNFQNVSPPSQFPSSFTPNINQYQNNFQSSPTFNQSTIHQSPTPQFHNQAQFQQQAQSPQAMPSQMNPYYNQAIYSQQYNAQVMHQYANAQANVATDSIENQLRKLKEESDRLEKEQQSIQMAKLGMFK